MLKMPDWKGTRPGIFSQGNPRILVSDSRHARAVIWGSGLKREVENEGGR